jgi:hypothetical protein
MVQSEGQAVEADRLRVAMKDAFRPVTELIATMPAMNKRERESRLKEFARQAQGALLLLLKDVDRLRAVVYELQVDPASMNVMAYGGRGDRPGPFVAGTPRGDAALALVTSREHLFVEDLSIEEPANSVIRSSVVPISPPGPPSRPDSSHPGRSA